MKKILLFMCSALLIGFCSCSSDDTDDVKDRDGSMSSYLESGQIELKGYPNAKTNKILFKAKAKKITIDWGGWNY